MDNETEDFTIKAEQFLRQTRLQWELETAKKSHSYWVAVEEQRRNNPEYVGEGKYRLINSAKKRVNQYASDIDYLTKQISEEQANQHE